VIRWLEDLISRQDDNPIWEIAGSICGIIIGLLVVGFACGLCVSLIGRL
jgi:hypothetical protein